MKIVMEGCKHKRVRQVDYGDFTAGDVVRATCLSCYQRLVNDGFNKWVPDIAPTFICDHSMKDPLDSMVGTKALCMKCGVALRHPDGPGKWTEIVFNGYIIKEEE